MDDGCQMFGGITRKKLETSIGIKHGSLDQKRIIP